MFNKYWLSKFHLAKTGQKPPIRASGNKSEDKIALLHTKDTGLILYPKQSAADAITITCPKDHSKSHALGY